MAETMHAAGPLYADDQALHARQQIQRQRNSRDGQAGGHDPGFRPEGDPDKVDHKPQNMPHEQDRQIGGAIIGAVVKQFFVAMRAIVRDLEIAGEQVPFAATGAALAQAAQHCGAGGPIVDVDVCV